MSATASPDINHSSNLFVYRSRFSFWYFSQICVQLYRTHMNRISNMSNSAHRAYYTYYICTSKMKTEMKIQLLSIYNNNRHPCSGCTHIIHITITSLTRAPFEVFSMREHRYTYIYIMNLFPVLFIYIIIRSTFTQPWQCLLPLFIHFRHKNSSFVSFVIQCKVFHIYILYCWVFN